MNRLVAILAVAVAMTRASACSGNCDGFLPGGTIDVALTGSTTTGTGRLDLCVDDSCASFDIGDALRTGLWLDESPASRPFAFAPPQPGLVVISIGRDKPARITATLHSDGTATTADTTLRLERTDYGSCHRPTYHATVPFDLRAASFVNR